MPPGAVSLETESKIFLPREIIQQPPLGLVAGSQSADPAAAFNDGQPGLVRAGDSCDPHAHLYDKGITAGSDHAVIVADLTVTSSLPIMRVTDLEPDRVCGSHINQFWFAPSEAS